MANGDLAQTAGIFTPVLSSADLRLGYDDINRLADALARASSFDAAQWHLSDAITPATGWGSLADPNNATSGTLAGGVRKDGNRLRGSWRQQYTGATAITAGSTGNIADTAFATLAAGFRPTAPRYIQVYLNGVGNGSGRIDPSGAVWLTDLYPTLSISSGGNNIVTVEFDVPLS